MLETQKDIEILIRARYPMIFCVSFEEARVETMVSNIAHSRGGQFLVWTKTRGFYDPYSKKIEGITNPEKALQFIVEQKGKVCFLLKDFHPYMKDPTIIRKLRDLACDLKLCQKNVVFISPTLTVPHELSKELAVVEIPLPNRDEISQIFDKISVELGVSLGISADEKSNIIESALGLTQEEVENIFAKSLVKFGEIKIDEILQEKRQIVQKSGILDFIPTEGKFGQIGGLAYLKNWLATRKGGFSQAAKELNLPTPKGILIVGPPGCGKSLTALCTGAAWKMPLLRLDMGKVFSGLVGSSEQNLRQALLTAESVSPCILWIDEIEKGLSGASSGGGDGGTTVRVFGTFLTWMQEKKKPVFVLATANDVRSLPPELLRKGRFDELFYADLPEEKDRLDILNIHLSKRKWQIEDFNQEQFGQFSKEFSGAEIEQALIDARYNAYFEERELRMNDLSEALLKTTPIAITMKEKIEETRRWGKERAVDANCIESKKGEQPNVRQVELGG